MTLGTPIEFTLYDDNDEIIATYRRARIPLMFAERASELGAQLENNPGSNEIKSMYQLIVEFFGEKFTVEDLRKGADLGELLVVLKAITARAEELMPPNPNPFPQTRKARRKAAVSKN